MIVSFGRGAVRVVAIAVTAALGGCGGGGGGGDGGGDTQANRPPVAGAASFTTQEDVQLQGQLSGSDPDSDSLTFSRTSDPARGAVSAFAANGSFTYLPNPNISGSDSFGFTISDGRGGTASATVSIQITNVDDPVVARHDRLQAAGAALANLNVLANDDNFDAKPVTVTIEEPAAVGVAAVNANGTVRITGLPAGFRGVTRFRYRATEQAGASSVATAVVFVDIAPFRAIFAGDEQMAGFPEVYLTDLTGQAVRLTAATEEPMPGSIVR
ncbi:MAG: cadherin-like domain-containing protein, partial [Opitutaceae bacterium]